MFPLYTEFLLYMLTQLLIYRYAHPKIRNKYSPFLCFHEINYYEIALTKKHLLLLLLQHSSVPKLFVEATSHLWYEVQRYEVIPCGKQFKVVIV